MLYLFLYKDFKMVIKKMIYQILTYFQLNDLYLCIVLNTTELTTLLK